MPVQHLDEFPRILFSKHFFCYYPHINNIACFQFGSKCFLRSAPLHLQAGKRVCVNATFSSNLANVTAARPCLLECMRLLGAAWNELCPIMTSKLHSLTLNHGKRRRYPDQGRLRLSLLLLVVCSISREQLWNNQNCTQDVTHQVLFYVCPSCLFLSCAVAGRALMIRKISPLSVYPTTSKRLREEKPIVI